MIADQGLNNTSARDVNMYNFVPLTVNYPSGCNQQISDSVIKTPSSGVIGLLYITLQHVYEYFFQNYFRFTHVHSLFMLELVVSFNKELIVN